MSIATVSPAVSGSEDVPLAQVDKIGTSEIMSFLALVASLLTVFFGKDFGIVQNARLIAEVAVFLIPMATGFARAIKHHGVAHANALVTVAQIKAAADALIAAQQTAAPGSPTPASATASAPSDPGGPSVSYGYSPDNPTLAGRHAAADVGADLPVTVLDAA